MANRLNLASSPALSIVALSAALLLALQVVASIGFLLGAGIGQWTLPLALALSLALFFWAQGLPGGTPLAATMAVTLWLFAILFAGSVYDNSWDGQHYHQELIVQLIEGWNPVYERWRAEERGIVDGEIGFWLNHYPRAGGIIGAAVYAMTDRIETAKFLNPLLCALVSIYAYLLLRTAVGLANAQAIFFSLTLGLNSIVATQLLTFYNDGALFGGLVLIVLAGAHLLAIERLWSRQARAPALILISAVVLAANLKFTGLVFGFAILSALGLVILVLRWGRWGEIFSFAALFLGATAGGILLVGPSPYLQNFFVAGHIFYPLMGEGAFDIVTRSTPFAFRDISSTQALFLSIFGEPNLFVENYNLQWPFTLPTWQELRVFAWYDPRVAGWGPFFPEQLILTVAGAVWLLALYRHLRPVRLGLFAFAIVVVLGLIHPEAWWARYSVFLLVGPWSIFLALWLTGQVWPKTLAAIGLALMFLNGALTAIVAWPVIYEVSGKISAQLDEVEAGPQPVRMSLGIFHSNRIKLRERGMKAIAVSGKAKLDCPEPKPFYNGHWISHYCP